MSFADPRIPSPDRCVLRPVLERLAAEQPAALFARFADGSEWNYGETLAVVRRTAAGLQALGVRQGDLVLSWLPNGPDALRVWFGLNYLGAVYVPINLAYRGELLAHVVRNSGARLMVAHADLVERLGVIERGPLAVVVPLGGRPAPIHGLSMPDETELWPQRAELKPLAAPIMPWDLQSVIYTSGTTGRSKGVRSTYLHLASCVAGPYELVGPGDRNLINLPLFHVGGTANIYVMLLRGASVAIVDSFKTETFWDTVRETGTTVSVVLGAMPTLLTKQPPRHDDADNPLRIAIMIPLSEDAEAFGRRFGCSVYTLFNMTEVSCPLVSARDPGPLGTCGRPRPGIEARVVDENDCEVAPGAVGELLVRADRPWSMTDGYHGDAEATARAWRNGWFHTGDAFRVDQDGNFFFTDRIKDAIRRRGENISSFEVEAELCAHPAVREAAAVAVASDLGEDEVLAVVAPASPEGLDPADLISFLRPRMAHFMIPRYVRFVSELPKTPTQKVQKHLLRSAGVTPDTWDREAAGIAVRREAVRALAGRTALAESA